MDNDDFAGPTLREVPIDRTSWAERVAEQSRFLLAPTKPFPAFRKDVRRKRKLNKLLRGSSRTYAYLIPFLPEEPQHQMKLCYLADRCIDTIADEPFKHKIKIIPRKKNLCNLLVDVLGGEGFEAGFVAV